MIEFAIAFSFLFPLLYGTFQFGYAFFVYHRLVNAVRSGARYASLETYHSATATPADDFASKVRNVVVYGDPEGGTAPLAPGLTPEHVVLIPGFVDGVPATMTVALANYRLDALFGIFTLNTPRSTFQYCGRYAPP